MVCMCVLVCICMYGPQLTRLRAMVCMCVLHVCACVYMYVWSATHEAKSHGVYVCVLYMCMCMFIAHEAKNHGGIHFVSFPPYTRVVCFK